MKFWNVSQVETKDMTPLSVLLLRMFGFFEVNSEPLLSLMFGFFVVNFSVKPPKFGFFKAISISKVNSLH